MNIIEMLQEMRSKQKYYANISQAEHLFRQQKVSIQAIKNEPWYNEIKNYRKREIESCIERLKTTKKGELPWVQAHLKVATGFLDFLDSLENAQE